MIIIQALLIIGFVYFLYRLLANPNSYQVKAWAKIFGIIFTIVAIMLVLFPDSMNSLAKLVGVSRGADLLLYLVTLAFILLALNIYLKSKSDQRRMVTLARKVAIIEAELKYKK